MLGVVATRYDFRRHMIFKSHRAMFLGDRGVPSCGCTILDAVVASCSASPFFNRHRLSTGIEGEVELIDGGFVTNNPTLFTILDAVEPLGIP